jgi:VWFA-related protein
MRIHSIVLSAVLAASGCALQAKAQPASPAGQPLPAPATIHVTVTDASGQLVSGLKKSDFKLLDDGHSVPIQELAASVPAQPPLVVIVMDQVNSTNIARGNYQGEGDQSFQGESLRGFQNLSIAQAQIGKFLASYQSRLPFPVSLVFLTDAGIKQIPPTNDGAALSGALHKHKPELQPISHTAGFYDETNLLEISLGDLQSILTYEARFPQRKLIVWVGPGWPVLDTPQLTLSVKQQKLFFQEIVTISNLLRFTNATVYSVDPEGNSDAATMKTVNWQHYLQPVSSFNKAEPGNLALQVLATQSGGLLRFGGNQVAQEISSCTQDASGGYDLTFQPRSSETPNTWRSLRVKVDRRGVTVRTLAGYYAQP